jgi:hypothetical protein
MEVSGELHASTALLIEQDEWAIDVLENSEDL